MPPISKPTARATSIVKGAPQKSISIFDTALSAHFKRGRSISGRGMFLIPRSYPETETGAMKPSTCYAHACTVAEVEVDDETGEVTVLSVKNVFEIGRALNPKMVEQQLVGGSWMGISHALYETTEPYYPNRDHGGTDFNQYLMPGPGDLAANRDHRAGTAFGRRSLRRQGTRRNVRQSADTGDRQCGLRRRRRAHRHAADHAGAHPARAESAGRHGELSEGDAQDAAPRLSRPRRRR